MKFRETELVSVPHDYYIKGFEKVFSDVNLKVNYKN